MNTTNTFVFIVALVFWLFISLKYLVKILLVLRFEGDVSNKEANMFALSTAIVVTIYTALRYL